jgi:transposase InsO family protein
MVRETEISERRACHLIGMHRWTFRYPGKPRDDRSLRERMRELAHRWPRFGYRRLIVLLRREGIEVNHDAPAKSHMVLAANRGHLGHPGADAMNQRRTIDQKAA